MRLYGLNDFTAPNPVFIPTDSSITFKYNPEAASGNYEDRFWWGKKPLTLTNYETAGTYAGGYTLPPNTISTVEITGLPEWRNVFVFVRRFADGAPTATTCSGFARTARSKLSITPPLLDKASNWQAETLFDYFLASSLMTFTMEEGSGYVALTGNNAYQMILDGVHNLSPRYDWEIEFDYQFPTGDDGAQNYYPHQCVLGASAGKQAVIAATTHGSHYSYYPNLLTFTGVGVSEEDLQNQGLTSVGEQRGYQIQAPAHPPLIAGDNDPVQIFWPRPLDNAKFIRDLGQRNVLKVAYDATAKAVRFWNNGVLFCTMDADGGVTAGGTFPEYMKRYPAGNHYALPVNAILRFEQMDATPNTDVRIYGVRVKSDCPYHYAGYQLGWGYHYSENWVADAGIAYDMESAHEMQGLSPYYGWGGTRFFCNFHDGWCPPRNSQTWPNNAGFLGSDTWGFPQTETFGKTLKAVRPADSRPKYVAFQGFQNCGYLKARLVDENGDFVAITGGDASGWVTPATIEGSPLLDIGATDAMELRCEVAMKYTGGQYYPDGMIEDQLPDNPLYFDGGSFPLWTEILSTGPVTPSLFAGFEVYFESLITSAVRNGDTVALSAWAGATTYFAWDADPIEDAEHTYSGSLTIPEGAQELRYYSKDGSHTEPVRTLTLTAGFPIKLPSGASGGVLKLITGADGGTLKVNAGGTWQ